MYLDYWQLTAKPFEPTADPAAFYSCETHEAAVLKLRYAVENRRGAVVLAGPGGVGKTMLAQMLRAELADTFSPQVHLVFPQMSSRDLLVYLAEQLARRPPIRRDTRSKKAFAGWSSCWITMRGWAAMRWSSSMRPTCWKIADRWRRCGYS